MRAAVNVLETLATENAVSGVTLRRAATSASPAVPRQIEPSANRIAAETPGQAELHLEPLEAGVEGGTGQRGRAGRAEAAAAGRVTGATGDGRRRNGRSGRGAGLCGLREAAGRAGSIVAELAVAPACAGRGPGRGGHRGGGAGSGGRGCRHDPDRRGGVGRRDDGRRRGVRPGQGEPAADDGDREDEGDGAERADGGSDHGNATDMSRAP